MDFGIGRGTLDFLLHNPNEIKTNDGSPYTIYSFFYKKARQFPIKKIVKNTSFIINSFFYQLLKKLNDEIHK